MSKPLKKFLVFTTEGNMRGHQFDTYIDAMKFVHTNLAHKNIHNLIAFLYKKKPNWEGPKTGKAAFLGFDEYEKWQWNGKTKKATRIWERD